LDGVLLFLKLSEISTELYNKFEFLCEKFDYDFPNIQNNLKRVNYKLKKLEKLTEQEILNISLDYFHNIRSEYKQFFNLILSFKDDILSKYKYLDSEILTVNNEISKLNQGIKQYPLKALELKEIINKRLKEKYGLEIKVDFLSDLIEIKDESWRNAIEGYLNTQRMYLVIAPEYFQDAYDIYKEIRHEKKIFEYRIIDCEKVFNDKKFICLNSLSEKIKSDNEYANAYIEFALGKVTMCFDDTKIRDHKISITESCMLYHGYTVGPINLKNYEIHYIGQNAIKQQIQSKKKLLLELTDFKEKIKTLYSSFNNLMAKEWFLTDDFIDTLVSDVYKCIKIKTNSSAKLVEIQNTLSKINMFYVDEMNEKIKLKEEDISAKTQKKEETNAFINEWKKEKEDAVESKLPDLKYKEKQASEKLLADYDKLFVDTKGEIRFSDEFKRLGDVEKIIINFSSTIKAKQGNVESTQKQLIDERSEFNRIHQYSYNISDTTNNEIFEKQLESIRDVELPKYKDNIKRAKDDAMEQFKSDFLYKLKSNIEVAYDKIEELNKAIRAVRFGNDTYRFEVKPNPDYMQYYDMITSSLLTSGNADLFGYEFSEKYNSIVENLFNNIICLSENISEKEKENIQRNIKIFSEYRTYLSFDLLSTDVTGVTQRLSKSINTKSGGETQTPFYIAVLASFAQLYKVKDTSDYGNTARLVIFDEAFNKMDSERITESVKLLRNFGLQAIVCAPPEEAADITPLADKTLLVYKDNNKSQVVEWTKEMSESLDGLQ